MSTVTVVVVILVVVALLAVGGALYLRQKRSAQLRDQFGSEYEREVAGAPNRAAAEKDLQERNKRHDKLDIRPLEPEVRADYRASWEKVQREFVDSPGDAVREADRLVIAIMTTRGYPTDDFEQRADDVSVEHPEVVEHYRQAHQVAVSHERGQAGTEHLRQAAISYRSLVTALLDDGPRGNQDSPGHDDSRDGHRSPDGGRTQRPDRSGATNGDRLHDGATTTNTDRSDA